MSLCEEAVFVSCVSVCVCVGSSGSGRASKLCRSKISVTKRCRAALALLHHANEREPSLFAPAFIFGAAAYAPRGKLSVCIAVPSPTVPNDPEWSTSCQNAVSHSATGGPPRLCVSVCALDK